MWFSRPPMYSQFVAIQRQPYITDVCDCSNKAGRYARCLRDVGRLEAKVLILRVPEGTHAIVEVKYKDRTWYCDPTSGKANHDCSSHGEVLRTVSEKDLYAGLEYR